MACMPNIANVLKAEIARVARKEVRAEVQDLKKTVVAQKAEVATLKRRVLDLEKTIKSLGKALPVQAPSPEAKQTETDGVLRFRPAGSDRPSQASGAVSDRVRPARRRIRPIGLPLGERQGQASWQVPPAR
jgi:hypothetical protein